MENVRVVLEYVTGILKVRDTLGLIGYSMKMMQSECHSEVASYIWYHAFNCINPIAFNINSAFVLSWTRSKQTSFSIALSLSVVVKKSTNICCLLHSGLWSMICVRLRMCVCTLCERVSWCVCLMMKRDFFPSSGVVHWGQDASASRSIASNVLL